MSDNNSGIKASKRRQMEARRRRLRRRKRKRAMLLGGMLCTACLILFSTIYGIRHLLHKHTDTKEAVNTFPEAAQPKVRTLPLPKKKLTLLL